MGALQFFFDVAWFHKGLTVDLHQSAIVGASVFESSYCPSPQISELCSPSFLFQIIFDWHWWCSDLVSLFGIKTLTIYWVGNLWLMCWNWSPWWWGGSYITFNWFTYCMYKYWKRNSAINKVIHPSIHPVSYGDTLDKGPHRENICTSGQVAIIVDVYVYGTLRHFWSAVNKIRFSCQMPLEDVFGQRVLPVEGPQPVPWKTPNKYQF